MNVPDKLFGGVVSRILISALLGFFFFLLFSYWGPKYAQDHVNRDLYYVVFGAVAQGFVGLVAFLGAVVVFQIGDQREGLLSLAHSVSPGNPWWVLHAHRETIRKSSPRLMGRSDYIESMKVKIREGGVDTTNNSKVIDVFSEMHENYGFEWEVRGRLMEFASISFVNVFLALILLSLANILSPFWGSLAMMINLVLSALVLRDGWYLIRRVIGYADDNL